MTIWLASSCCWEIQTNTLKAPEAFNNSLLTVAAPRRYSPSLSAFCLFLSFQEGLGSHVGILEPGCWNGSGQGCLLAARQETQVTGDLSPGGGQIGEQKKIQEDFRRGKREAEWT